MSFTRTGNAEVDRALAEIDARMTALEQALKNVVSVAPGSSALRYQGADGAYEVNGTKVRSK